jgi:endonuclease/exonuclease/phosphatase (EEP) superfamily protein YafD
MLFATLIAYGGRWSWFADLLVNFRTHYLLALIVALVVAVVGRHWRIASAAIAGLALNGWPVYGAYTAKESSPISDARPVRIASFNMHITNDNLREALDYLDAMSVDIAVLQETSPSNVDRLQGLDLRLPHRYLAFEDGIWGVVILSRWPLAGAQPATREGVTFAARVDVDLGDRQLRLYGAHLNWPVMPDTARIRNAQLRELGLALSECPHACVAVGDFNVTPWSSHFRGVLENPRVRNCAAGRGLLPTWSSDLPAVLRIRIDHCLFAGAVAVANVRVGKSMGSDHFATINDLLIGGN